MDEFDIDFDAPIFDVDDDFEDEQEDDYDGQPDEMQEWADFDPDC